MAWQRQVTFIITPRDILYKYQGFVGTCCLRLCVRRRGPRTTSILSFTTFIFAYRTHPVSLKFWTFYHSPHLYSRIALSLSPSSFELGPLERKLGGLANRSRCLVTEYFATDLLTKGLCFRSRKERIKRKNFQCRFYKI